MTTAERKAWIQVNLKAPAEPSSAKRTATPNQVRFIQDLQGLVTGVAVQDAALLGDLSFGEASFLIDLLKAQAPTPGPSPKQESFLRSLCDERSIDLAPIRDLAVAQGTWTSKEVSKLIDQVKATPRTGPRSTPPAWHTNAGRAERMPERSTADVPLGVHLVPDPQGRTVEQMLAAGVVPSLVQVKRSKRTGGCYGKIRPADGKGWEYRRGLLAGLDAGTLLTGAQASVLGVHFGVCQVCAADLTDPKSVAAGIGPVCAKRVGKWSSPGARKAQEQAARLADAPTPVESAHSSPPAQASQEAPGAAQSDVQDPQGGAVAEDLSAAGRTAPVASGGTSGSTPCPWHSGHRLVLEGEHHGWDGPTCAECGGPVILDVATRHYVQDNNRLEDGGGFPPHPSSPLAKPTPAVPVVPDHYEPPVRSKRRAPEFKRADR